MALHRDQSGAKTAPPCLLTKLRLRGIGYLGHDNEKVRLYIEETFTFYRLPKEHHKHLKSTNVLERLNQELKRRTQVIRIFPNEASALRLLRALAVEIHEGWLESPRYLNMEALREQRKTELRKLLAAA